MTGLPEQAAKALVLAAMRVAHAAQHRARQRSHVPGAVFRRRLSCIVGAMGTRLGVISDTHGLVRPEALAALAGSELILHAGDIGAPEVLDALRALAPVRAVRGNNDRGRWADGLVEIERVQVERAAICLLHDVGLLRLDPVRDGIQVVVAGHSHRPRNELRDGVLYFNPGAAGPRRFRLPVTVGRLDIDGARVTGTIVPLL